MIIGNKEVIENVKSAKPGDSSVLVSLEALENLPEIYDAKIEQVTFIPPCGENDGDFSPVGGGKYMPSVDLMNKIAEARGIHGMDMAIIEPVYEEIDWNRMTLNYSDPPKLARYLVGYRCTKQGKVLTEDGTERISDPCTVIYNAWERVCEIWSKEEQYTDNYTHPAKYPNKYDSMAKRRACFDSEMKFAERKADSKARNVVIRTICGMPTGYDVSQLKKGYFVFGKIVRSSWAIKSEHAARLQAISRGVSDDTAKKALFGPSSEEKAVPVVSGPSGQGKSTPVQYFTEDEQAESVPADIASEALESGQDKPITGKWMKTALETYVKDGAVGELNAKAVTALIVWLGSQATPETHEAAWKKALLTLDNVEKDIPQEMRVSRK